MRLLNLLTIIAIFGRISRTMMDKSRIISRLIITFLNSTLRTLKFERPFRIQTTPPFPSKHFVPGLLVSFLEVCLALQIRFSKFDLVLSQVLRPSVPQHLHWLCCRATAKLSLWSRHGKVASYSNLESVRPGIYPQSWAL
jgi:hypothetical protein